LANGVAIGNWQLAIGHDNGHDNGHGYGYDNGYDYAAARMDAGWMWRWLVRRLW